MKHQWKVCRQFTHATDAQRRWDRAYQLLLHWATIARSQPTLAAEVGSDPNQEAYAVYLRISTLRQAQAQSCEQQLDRLRHHIQTQGWQLSEKDIFRDDGYSGVSLRRPGLDHLETTPPQPPLTGY